MTKDYYKILDIPEFSKSRAHTDILHANGTLMLQGIHPILLQGLKKLMKHMKFYLIMQEKLIMTKQEDFILMQKQIVPIIRKIKQIIKRLKTLTNQIVVFISAGKICFPNKKQTITSNRPERVRIFTLT